jgi:hypothetical protein
MTTYPISKILYRNNEQLKDKLSSLYACEESIEWLNERNAEQMWNGCPRGDWMLWLLKKLNLNKRKLTLCKGKCSETVKHLMKDERSIKAVEVAIRYGYSEATEEELSYAADAAADAYASAYAADAYAAAAYAAAAYAADAYAAADADADAAAAYAADAYAYADATAYADAAKKENQLLTANIIRQLVPFNELLELLNHDTN